MLLRTLGGLRLYTSDFHQTKPLLLLAYLALEEPRARPHLWTLFWPDAGDPANSLRVALHGLKRVLPDALHAQGERVAVQLQTDAQTLLDGLEAGDTAGALMHYHGPFLDGVGLSGTGLELEEWVYATRELLARRVRAALLRLAEEEAAGGRAAAAASQAERAYTLAGAPELEPEEIRRLYPLLVGGGSLRAAKLRREAVELGLTLAPFVDVANIARQANPVPTVSLAAPPAASSATVPPKVTFVSLLGRAAVQTQTGPLEPPPGKTTALLYYLAYRGGWVDRDDLVYLFYPDLGENKARQNLRPLLTRLRQLPYSEGLTVEPTRLRWEVRTDVGAFKDALKHGRLAEAVQQYRGDLLEGFHVSGAPEFGSWLELERRELQRLWREAALTLAAELESQGRHPHAAELLKRVYQTDPLEETLFRRYFRALAIAGRASDALQAFETFRTLLADEVAGEPESDTYALVARVRSGQGLETFAVPPKTYLAKPKPTVHTTAFVGREAEIRVVALQLREPACRLLSVLGPGGIGKTRLASEVGARLEPDFTDGLCFVPFAATPSPALMVSAVASALHFAFLGERDPQNQLLEHLADKAMLLVLDNLEHLLEGAGLVAALVQAAPKLKILTTSRERLNLHAEWVYDLAGMSVLEANGRDLESAAAVRLFLQTARKARADFSLGNQIHTTARICRALGGMPLAIELAASWLRVLSVAEVAEELGKGLGLLESPLRDLPERHHDLRAVFGASWRRLSEPEQVALPKLAVFQGGFGKEAARAVADASLPLLLALVNKSFVQVEGSGRFSLHPLVGQYLLDKARADAETLAHTCEQHAVYFAAFMQRREALHSKPEAKAVRAEIVSELPNLRAAWFWAAAQKREDLLAPMLGWLTYIHQQTGRYKEAEDLFAYAADTLRSRSVVHGRILCDLGRVKGWQLEHEQEATLLEQSIAIFQERGAKHDEALALRALVSNYDFSFHSRGEVNELRETVRTLFRDLGDKRGEAWELGKLSEYYQDP